MTNPGPGVTPQTLDQQREWITDFISMAAHDLREPLRTIRLGSHLLLADGRADSDENAAQGARYLAEGTDRIEALVRSIAAYCYEEVCEVEFEETDLNWVLVEAKNELAKELESTCATITHDPLPTVTGIPASLGTVFCNLISNACKFRSGAAPCIHIGVERQESQWIFGVQDNGIGFRPTYSERVFRPFERLNGKQFPGTGLGLTLARKIIEHHGGSMWADSAPGSGSTFWFSLPFRS